MGLTALVFYHKKPAPTTKKWAPKNAKRPGFLGSGLETWCAAETGARPFPFPCGGLGVLGRLAASQPRITTLGYRRVDLESRSTRHRGGQRFDGIHLQHDDRLQLLLLDAAGGGKHCPIQPLPKSRSHSRFSRYLLVFSWNPPATWQGVLLISV